MTPFSRAAVIGLGNISNRHRKNLRALYPDVRIYSVSASGRNTDAETISDCDEIIGSVEELAKLKPDLTIIASPASFHLEHVAPLIQNNLAVLIEKPVVTTGDEVGRLFDLFGRSSAHLAVAYCLRFLPSAQFIKKLVGEKKLGAIYNVFIEVGQFLPDWRPAKDYMETVSANKHLGGGALLELSHELDYARWIFGKMELRHASLRSSDELSLDVEDMVDLVYSQDQGAVVQVHLDFIQKKPRRMCTILAESGRLEWDLIGNTVSLYDKRGERTLFDGSDWDKNQMYLDMLQSFIMKDFRYLATAEEAGQVVSMVDSAKSFIYADKNI